MALEDLPAFRRFGELALVPAGEADENALGIELPHDVLERVPRGAVGPLHLVEHEHQRPRDRRHSQIREELLEEAVLAAGRFVGCPRTQRWNELVELAPFALRRFGQSMQAAEDRRPDGVRLTNGGRRRRRGDHRTAAKPHLRLELAKQRCRSQTRLTQNRDDARASRYRIVDGANERRQLFGAPGEPVDAQRAMEDLMMRERRERRAVSALGADSRARRVRDRVQVRDRISVIGHGRDADRQAESVDDRAIGHGETVGPYRGRQSLARPGGLLLRCSREAAERIDRRAASTRRHPHGARRRGACRRRSRLRPRRDSPPWWQAHRSRRARRRASRRAEAACLRSVANGQRHQTLHGR